MLPVPPRRGLFRIVIGASKMTEMKRLARIPVKWSPALPARCAADRAYSPIRQETYRARHTLARAGEQDAGQDTRRNVALN